MTLHSSSDRCNTLPDAENLGTTVKFPVSYNAPIKVTCNVGYSLEGSDVITCIKGEEYQDLPTCKHTKRKSTVKRDRLDSPGCD